MLELDSNDKEPDKFGMEAVKRTGDCVGTLEWLDGFWR